MANIIKPKRSNTAAKVPTTTELISGELGVNMADRKVYINNGTAVVQVGAGNLSGLGDVAIATPANGQALTYNSTTSKWENTTSAGSGTVTSVGITAGTGVTVSNSPITTSGNIAVGLSTKLTAIQNLSGAGFITQNGSGAIAGRTLQAGTGISIQHGNGSSQDPIITNSAPDQTVALTGAGATTISGTYPNFTITSVNTTYGAATSTVPGLIELASDTAQTVAANAITTTASRTYGLQLNSAGQGVVNVPWTDTVYSLPAATSTVRGGIELGSNTAQTVASNAVTATASRSYALQVNADGQGVVNVPWTDTVYSLPAATSTIRGGIELGSDTAQTVAANAVTATASRSYALQVNADGQGVVNVPWTDSVYSLPAATATVRGGIELGSNTAQTVAANAVSATASRSYALQVNADGQGVVNVPWTDTNSGGTVTSVGGTGTVSGLTLTGTVTTSGDLTLGGTLAVTPSDFSSQTAKTFLAAPNAAAGVPTFRAIVASDVPTLNQSTTGNAATATTLQTARTINGVSFNGSANITVADSTKLPLAGGAMTGPITGTNASADAGALTVRGGNSSSSGVGGALSISGGNTVSTTAGKNGGTVTVKGGDNTSASGGLGGLLELGGGAAVLGTGGQSRLYSGDSKGTNISGSDLMLFAGKGTGTGVGGTFRIYTSGTTTSGTGLQTSTSRFEVNNVGQISLLANIASTSTTTGTLKVTGGVGVSGTVYAAGFNGALTGNATTATTLQTARTIGGVSFNGSANINLPGVNTAGNQNTSGSAATLTTGRTIAMTGDVTYTSGSFNGSANVTGTSTLANSGVTAGTYTKVTVNAKGLATSGTTLAASDIPELTMAKLPGAAYKESVRCATTANITLSGTQTIDGIAVVAGNRVLVKNQTTASQNGIYIVAAGAWTRSLDADAASEIGAAIVNVDSGTANGGELWTTTFKITDTLGTTAMNWYEVLYNSGSWGISITGSSASTTVTTSATASAFKVPFANTTASTTGNYGLLQDSTATFTYNPSTNTLAVGTVSGALSGNASTATTLQTSRTIQTNLASTAAASFNGSANITPGVTGTLPIANGGTGATTAAAARTALGAGTVTSVGGTGTISGLTLTGTVTSSGSLTLGGNLTIAADMIYNSFTATAAQTTFTTTNTYTSGKIEVFVNGVKMVNGSDVTVTSGTSVVMASGLPVGTRVDLVYPI